MLEPIRLEPPVGLHFNGKLLALPTNIRLGHSGSPGHCYKAGSKALAYFCPSVSDEAEKFYTVNARTSTAWATSRST